MGYKFQLSLLGQKVEVILRGSVGWSLLGARGWGTELFLLRSGVIQGNLADVELLAALLLTGLTAHHTLLLHVFDVGFDDVGYLFARLLEGEVGQDHDLGKDKRTEKDKTPPFPRQYTAG